MAIAGGCAQEDLDKAMAIVDKGERVLAVWKATPEQAQSAACQPFQIVIFLPCFLPHLCFLSPCAIACFLGNKTYIENTLWILTDKKLYKASDASPPGGLCCCIPHSNTAHGSVALSQIVDITDNLGGQCAPPLCAVPKVFATVPPGHSLANAGGGKHRPHHTCAFIVDDKEQAMALLRSTKQAAEQMGMMAAMPMHAMPAMAMQAMPMQSMRVECPAGCKGGDSVTIQAPSGQMCMVVIPPGLSPGDAFEAQVQAMPVQAVPMQAPPQQAMPMVMAQGIQMQPVPMAMQRPPG